MPYNKPTEPDTDELELAAAADDLDLGNVVIHKSALPYVTEWFNDSKRVGDTPVKFILRMMYAEALRHRAAKLRAANQGPGSTDDQGAPVDLDNHTDQAADYSIYVVAEESRLASVIEGILP